MAGEQTPLELIEQAAKENRSTLAMTYEGLTTLPREIGTLTNLSSLDLTGNQLATLPWEVTNLTNLSSLNLSGNRLTTLTPEIRKLRNLTEIDLSGNRLGSVPEEIVELTKLSSLDLSGNNLGSVPSHIAKLVGLTSLDLSDNQLKELPSDFTRLINLAQLNLRHNRFTSLPLEITELVRLSDLNLGENQLTALPPEIAKLTNLNYLGLYETPLGSLPLEITDLTNLSGLILSHCQLTDLPPEIGKLSKLRRLGLGGNRLTGLPPEIIKLSELSGLLLWSNQLKTVPTEIMGLSNLSELSLSDNQLTSVPPAIATLTQLTLLDLSNNRLTSLPAEIARLTKLDRLELDRNPLPIPPETLANPKDVKAIFAAISGSVSGERLNEAKMLVLGDGNVGKSSVVERLIYNTFNPGKQTTLGVEINDEMQVVQSEVKGEGEPVKLNIWDFGGQEIQHSTHQFFLTTRSLYLLVVDARKGDQISNIEYWLKLIESFGGAESPIIIVINQIDQLKGQRELNLDRNALKAKYNIRAFIPTSCETGEGISELKDAIARQVGEMKHVHDLWPPEWLAIKRRLKDMHDDYIPVEKYLDICCEENLNDQEIQRSLLDMLHVLGTVVRFPGDTQVLNPRWVTQGVYGLLTSEQLVKTRGQFDLKDLGKLLVHVPDAKDQYPSHTHERLIKVMRHFELCFEFTDRPGHYLIPRHLHDTEPDVPWDDADGLKFEYRYETLPDSVISRFIVRMNQYITTPFYWKNGVFLQSSDGNLAKIKADAVDRTIFISVIGKEQTRRAFLAVIRSAFDEINSNFKIDIKQMIPVQGSPKVLVSYQDLLAYEEMNEFQIVVPELRKKFSVKELLDGVEEPGARIRRRENESGRTGLARGGPEPRRSKSQPQILRVVVASPGDVQAERDLMPSVIDEVNRLVAADLGLRLELSRWETDAHPGFHPEGPQGLIDPILKIADCDLLIGIFWKRFGTPTNDGKTGTEHEFGVAHKAWKEEQRPQIFVYFNLRAYTPKSRAEAEQWGQVLDFRDRFPKEGLWWPYKGKAQFEKLVRNHLMNYINNLH